MTVTKSKNLIANRNTGGNKKQGLVSSIGKSNSIRQSQLVRASSNDKTIYCINQVGGVGRFRNQLSSADSTNCMSNAYTISSALQDSIKSLHTFNNYLFAFILIYNSIHNTTHVFINIGPYYNYTFNHINLNIQNHSDNNILDISFNNISIKQNNTVLLYKFNNADYSFNSGNVNIINKSSVNYNDISNNDTSLINNGFLVKKDNNGNTIEYSANATHTTKDNNGFEVNYSPFYYGSLYEYLTNSHISKRLKNEFYANQNIHLKQN
jgi:hypothetical protein